MSETNIREHLEPLQMIDIEKCTTVGKTVEQMANSAMGARMIGEAAETIVRWIKEGKTPWVIFDNPDKGFESIAINGLFREMAEDGYIQPVISNSHNYARSGSEDRIIVVGFFLNEWEDNLFENGAHASLFINNFNLAPPWVKDGYFRGFVNADHRLALPILKLAVQEKLSGKPVSHSALLEVWAQCQGVARQAAHGFATLRQMIEDPDCTVFLTISGIGTMAGFSGLISYMIDQGWVQAIAATGALIGHGFVEGVGKKHYKYDPQFDDVQMAEQKLNRIGTTVEPEENLDHVERIMAYVLEEKLAQGGIISPSRICHLIGEHLAEKYPGEISILRSAYEKNIPIFIPAFHDSELGNDLLIHNWRRRELGQSEVIANYEIDSLELVKLMTGSKKIGIISLGGGSSRNNMQNGAPLVEIMNVRLKLGLRENKYVYGCRICPDEVYLEHLSGCTYRENGSWRKTDLEHGRFSEVLSDYSIVFPFCVAALREILEGR
jgi:deoxyhypusine synthase